MALYPAYDRTKHGQLCFPHLGYTWGPTNFIVDDVGAPDGLHLGTEMVDDYIPSIKCGHYLHNGVYSVMVTYSSDDGINCSTPRNISHEIGTEMFALDPGSGIQKSLI